MQLDKFSDKSHISISSHGYLMLTKDLARNIKMTLSLTIRPVNCTSPISVTDCHYLDRKQFKRQVYLTSLYGVINNRYCQVINYPSRNITTYNQVIYHTVLPRLKVINALL